MINLEIKEEKFKIKNNYSEITLGELDVITTIFENKESSLEQWFSVIELLSDIKESHLDLLPIDSAFKIIDSMFKDKVYYDTKIQKELIIEGVTYKVPQDSYNIRQGILIEKVYKEDSNKFKVSTIMSILLSDKLSKEEIENNVSIFKNQPASLFLPIIAKLGINLTNNIKESINDYKTA